MTEMPSLLNEQVLNGMMEMESVLRRKAEESLRAQVRLLAQIASAFAGRDFDRVRKQDPNAVYYWSPHQWQAFFNEFVLPLSQSLTWAGESGSKVDLASHRKLEQENDRLRRQLEAAHRDIQKKVRELEKLQSQLEALQAAFQALGEFLTGDRMKENDGNNEASCDLAQQSTRASSSPPEPGAAVVLPAAFLRRKKPRRISEDGVSPIGYEQVLEDLAEWKPIPRPARYPRLLEAGVSEERWQRQCMALYVLARYGLGVRMELDWLISHLVGTKTNSGSQRLTIDMLADFGLVVRRRLYESTPPLGSQLVVFCLSQDGRQLCELFGWQIVESDWERIVRLHCQGDPDQEKAQEAHTLNILSFIRNARYRGYRAMAVPLVPGKSFPDVYIERGEEFSYVEVERSVKDKSHKWQHQAELQGHVALCAVDQKSRARLVGDCKLNRSIRHGRATDMHTLMELAAMHKDKVGETPLWAEEW